MRRDSPCTFRIIAPHRVAAAENISLNVRPKLDEMNGTTHGREFIPRWVNNIRDAYRATFIAISQAGWRTQGFKDADADAERGALPLSPS